MSPDMQMAKMKQQEEREELEEEIQDEMGVGPFTIKPSREDIHRIIMKNAKINYENI